MKWRSDGRERRGTRPRLVFAASVMVVITAVLTTPVAHAAGSHVIGPKPPYGVGVTRCTFVDTTRSVLNYATSPPSVLSRRRTLVTEIRYPTLVHTPSHAEITNAPPVHLAQGFALVMFAHGYDITPGAYATLLERWTQEGYVVAAPIFPDENGAEVRRQRVNTEADLDNEPADLAFVARGLLSDSSTHSLTCPLVYGLVRPGELVLAGHSDGADAVGLLAFSAGHDPQGVSFASLRQGLSIRATMIFSGSKNGTAPYGAQPSRAPLLLIQSAFDYCNLPTEGVKLYGAIRQSDKWFLELLHAHHLPPFDGEDHAAFELVVSTTSSFLDYALGHTVSASSLNATGNARPLVGRMTPGGNGPTIADPRDPPPCGYH